VHEAVADVVRRQTEAGVDFITDGEQAKFRLLRRFVSWRLETDRGLRTHRVVQNSDSALL
jgi:hypothetical protein